MPRTARWNELPEADAASVQASFDFLPEEMRTRNRFGSGDQAAWAQRRAQLKLVDRQVITTGSRLAAARLREILRPAEPSAPEQSAAEAATATTESQRLQQQRADLRALGAALFYFRDEPSAVTADEGDARQQRLHPRPLPARYFA
ncbi:hypothetical protein [Dongia rigui]|uniref:Uncharacterized protein n=1 Tax=Dongia rigui TaxID=940149 RepID=A0ABU5E022_9PROT|nr:hypothetical protein [Dongia rigui]MDY0872238.1 hypothetical protein [Dongia rigui]